MTTTANIPTVLHNGITYDDVLEIEWADSADATDMAIGSHYDYRAQTWVTGHDHAHYSMSNQDAPLLYCGADAHSCYGATLPR